MEEINYCPNCGQNFKDTRSLLNEYWNADLNIVFCWCHNCHWQGEITRIKMLTATEPDE
jgi:C4-type Zn-finger protein